MKRILKLIIAMLFFTGMAVAQEKAVSGENGGLNGAAASAGDVSNVDSVGQELAACKRKQARLEKHVITLVERLEQVRAARKVQVAELRQKLEKAERRPTIPASKLQVMANRLRKAERRLNAILDELESIIGK